MTEHLQQIAQNNVRRFILFRMLFNARFYYPVFAVIFLDFGISLDQFALLNVIWAGTIILAEVPSGALSDLIGRKKLLVLTASLMVIEMAVWAFAPRGNPTLLFWLLAGNRVLSGLGEASASGSDEALVYESLEEAGQKDQWSKVLERVSKWQSVAFMIAMITGGLVYDSTLLSRWVGFEVPKEITLRIPLYLTFITSIFCLFNCLGFQETKHRIMKKNAYPSAMRLNKPLRLENGF
jgi:MFS family permease